MKRKSVMLLAILLIAGALVSAITYQTMQNPDNGNWKGYEKEWAIVDSLEGQGLPASALKAAEAIYVYAKTDKNDEQIVKAIIHKAKYTSMVEENEQIKAIHLFQEEIETSSGVIKSVLQSMTAEIYWNYYTNNRWRFNNRSKTVDFKNEDISTWDVTTLHQKTYDLYVASIANREELKKVKTSRYNEILLKGDEYGQMLRPTMYDFLAHRALDFLMNDEVYITDPAYAFNIDNPVVFGSNKAFAGFVFSAEEVESKKLLALRIFQDLTLAHLYDPYPAALIDVDIKRLNFAKNNTIINNKDSLYLNALIAEEKLYANDSSSTRISFLIAQYHYSLGSNYVPLAGPEYKWEYETAIKICNDAIKKFPNSLGAINCASLKATIEQKELSLVAEQINIPEKPFRVLVGFRNVDTVFFRVVKVSQKDIDKIKVMEYDVKFNELTKYPVYKSWSQQLPLDGDYQDHFTEIKVDGLPLGSYYLIASTNAGFSFSENKLIAQEIIISNLSYFASGNDYYGTPNKDFYVLDRSTGKPIKGASIQTFRKEYDYNKRDYNYNPLKTYTTDENGMFSVSDPLIKDYYYFSFSITYNNDFLSSGDNYYISKENKPNTNSTFQTYFFTDRAIYRPGQTIYFKGIMVERSYDGKKQTVVSNKKSTILFYDVNSQVVAKIDVTTNDYGSFNGTFTAPQTGITGQMRISNETGSTFFSVEEYKRPTFSVSNDPVTGGFVLGDTITVTGKAISYAGANIDNAKVAYRVVRNTYYPYYYSDYYWWRRPAPVSAEMEITNGTSTTDAEGKFAVTFKAIADLTADKKLLPHFSYTIYVDVTDVSGETRSQETYVTVGYTALNLFVNAPETITTGKNITLNLTTNNLNGSRITANGKVEIFALETPNKLFRERTWQQQDVYTMSKEEYYKLFPHDLYADESNMYAWPVTGSVLKAEWSTEKSDSLVLNTAALKQGVYKIEVSSIDISGEVIKVVKYISVLNQGNYAATPKYNFTTTESKSYKPGENAVINIGSSAKNINALLEITRADGVSARKWITLPEVGNRGSNATVMDVEIPISESDRGGVSAQICFVKDGRFYNQQYFISVPWDNKDLKLTLETHRDKLQPGATETWKIKITGNNGEKVAAELLANMYDASLDAFVGHYWNSVSWPSFYTYKYWTGVGFGNGESLVYTDYDWYKRLPGQTFNYTTLNWFGIYWGVSYYRDYYFADGDMDRLDNRSFAGAPVLMEAAVEKSKMLESEESMGLGAIANGNVSIEPVTNSNTLSNNSLEQVSTRTNLNETAFFYPHLETDAEGNIAFTFTMPEALTTWNFMGFAHTKEMQSAQLFDKVVTQKELMIQPNAPRFLREGDEIVFTAKVSNLTENELSGNASLELFDALTMQPIDNIFGNTANIVAFKALAKGSAAVSWKLKIPSGYDAIVYKVKAASGTFTDGEENALPVLSNRILVTEALPLWVRGNQSKLFTFDKLLAAKGSSTIRNQSLTLEYTSNPAWYAVQALPYMMEYPYECAEQVFSRYYANSIAYHIANSDPEIKRVFDSWKNNATSLTSNLEKNQELKQLLLAETPWVLQAQNETERKKRVALLFDLNRMNTELQSAINKLEKMQLPNGGWPWFKGYEDDRYITQYIVTGLAHLQQLGITNANTDAQVSRMLNNAMAYCNNRMVEDYRNLEKYKIDKATHVPGNITVQYLYAASYFGEDVVALSSEQKIAKDYYIGQLVKYWTKYSIYEKGMIALILHREDQSKTAAAIVKSLKEFSLNSDEMGMYWKDNLAGYYWYQAPIETQSLMIEVFGEVGKDEKAVEDLKVWLLRQKQTTDWKTTRATAEACYALLLRGNNLLSNKELAIITVGKLLVKPESVEAGTGYFKTNWLGTDINNDYGKISITPPSTNSLSYGAMYWQYFEDIDKVTASNNNLQINKQLFLQQNTATGPVIKPITDKTELHVGDLIKVRIEIRVDRNMEYVHMKDMRASGFEPVNVLSQYKWQDGLGYYEATGDAATNFFIAYLNKGTYVFEYPLRVAHSGNFSNGITTIQCMYAPEFTSHSEGIRVQVK